MFSVRATTVVVASCVFAIGATVANAQANVRANVQDSTQGRTQVRDSSSRDSASRRTVVQDSFARDSSARDSSAKRALTPVVITASRRPERATDAVVPTTVITREDIRRSGASDVASVLLQQPGVQVGAGTPAGTNILIQGFGDQRVLILLDGQPLTGRIGGSFDLSRLPTSLVDHIEIVEGPQSVLYGSDAMGGVVNIVTRRPGTSNNHQFDGEMQAIVGSHGRVDVTGRLGGDVGWSGAYAIDVGRRHIRLAPGIRSDVDTYAKRWDVAPQFRWTVRPGFRIDLGSLYVDEQQRYRTGQLYTFSDNTQIAGNIGATWTHGTHRFSPTISYTSFEHLSRAALSDVPASDSGAIDKQRLIQAGLAYSGLASNVIFDAGIEARHESITADRVSNQHRSINWGAFYGQATWQVGTIALVPGLRLSSSDAWGTTLTPRLAMRVRPLGDDGPLTMRLSVASGFRAPDFKEMYLRFVNASAGYAVNGNANLSPERSTNVSADAEWLTGATVVRLSAFHNRFRDFIETVGPDSTGTYTYDNIALGSTRGLDVDVRRRWHYLGVAAGYGYLHTHNDTDGGPLLGRATHRANVTFDGMSRSGATRGSITTTYTGAAPSARDSLGRVSDRRSPMTQVNVRMSQSLFSHHTDLFAGVDNLFNTKPNADWPGFVQRLYYVGMTWKRP